tara:strand:- start:2081 stop:2449 length:369 start_codon:yes stop_codon:yes gene_type:complete
MAAVELSNHLAPGGGKIVLLYKSGGTAAVNKTLANLATGGETVTAADITRIYYTGAGTLTIKRNTTPVFISDVHTSFDWDLKEAGISLSANNDQAINVVFSDANSTAIIELQKTSNHSSTQY